MDTAKKTIEEVMEDYNHHHNVPVDVTETITHDEFVSGLRDRSVGFAPKGGKPTRLMSGPWRVIFAACVFFYLLLPALVIPLWARHERNWWLLLGIVVACVIAPQLAQRKGNVIGGALFLASLVLLITRGFTTTMPFSASALFGAIFSSRWLKLFEQSPSRKP